MIALLFTSHSTKCRMHVEFVEVLPLASIMGGSPHSIFGNPRLPDVSLPLHQVTVGLQCTLGLWGGCTMVLLILSRGDTLSKKMGCR